MTNQVRTVVGKDRVKMYDFLRGLATDDLINMRVAPLTQKVEAFLDMPVSRATVSSACEDLDIQILRNNPREPDHSAENNKILISKVATLEEKVEYLMQELGCRKDFNKTHPNAGQRAAIAWAKGDPS